MSLDLPALAAALAAHGPLVRILVLRAGGSAPREAGTAMLVWAEGSAGTIGGGALEWEAMAAARAMLAGGPVRAVRTLPLGPALGQCCGGSVTLVWERLSPADLPRALPWARPLDGGTDGGAGGGAIPARVAAAMAAWQAGRPPAEIAGWLIEGAPAPARPIWIWGAGHVGRAIVAVLAPLPGLALTWVDIAPDRFPAAVPDGVTALPAADPVALVPHAPPQAEHLILTHSHALDLALCHALLSHGFGSAGLIGSATKRARFRARLAALGHPPAQIARIACPIGDPALGKHPQAIAVGVAAALLKARATGTGAATGMTGGQAG